MVTEGSFQKLGKENLCVPAPVQGWLWWGAVLNTSPDFQLEHFIFTANTLLLLIFFEYGLFSWYYYPMVEVYEVLNEKFNNKTFHIIKRINGSY